MDNLKRIESMLNILKNMKADEKKRERLNSIRLMDTTPKQAGRINADLNWIAMENIKRKHELHALAVELGFAEMRDSYEEFELTDGWHRYNHKPRTPFN